MLYATPHPSLTGLTPLAHSANLLTNMPYIGFLSIPASLTTP